MLHPYALEFITGQRTGVVLQQAQRQGPDPLGVDDVADRTAGGFPLIYEYKLFFAEGLVRMLVSRAGVRRRRGLAGAAGTPQVDSRAHVSSFYRRYVLHHLPVAFVGVGGDRSSLATDRGVADSRWDNALFLLMMAAVLCYGALAYRFFEKPVLDWATACTSPSPSAPAPADRFGQVTGGAGFGSTTKGEAPRMNAYFSQVVNYAFRMSTVRHAGLSSV